MKAVRNTVEGEVYFYHNGLFCPCCGMALRVSSTSKRDRARLRQLRLIREEEDSIIRIIKGIKSSVDVSIISNDSK